jgi:hypothetical protein
VDVAAHYRHLLALGREEFLAAAAPAAFVRYPSQVRVGMHTVERLMDRSLTLEETLEVPLLPASGEAELELELFPLVKKPGASFPDRITIGRTQNNDIVIVNHSVSRLHAYVRQAGDGWVVADAGSKNGSWLRGAPLEPRREQALPSQVVLRLGEVELTFYVANDLYAALGGS